MFLYIYIVCIYIYIYICIYIGYSKETFKDGDDFYIPDQISGQDVIQYMVNNFSLPGIFYMYDYKYIIIHISCARNPGHSTELYTVLH
jgi:hypothetical protein